MVNKHNCGFFASFTATTRFFFATIPVKTQPCVRHSSSYASNTLRSYLQLLSIDGAGAIGIKQVKGFSNLLFLFFRQLWLWSCILPPTPAHITFPVTRLNKNKKVRTVNDLADNELRFRDMDLPKATDLKSVQNMIKVFEQWCYRRMLRISWTEHVTNEEVFNMANTKPTLLDGLLKMRNINYTEAITIPRDMNEWRSVSNTR